MKQSFLTKLFSDNNDINEKSVIGFASFGIMSLFAFADLLTGYFGKDLIINEFIYNSFMIMTLGALGIGSVDKFINKKSSKSEDEDVVE